MEYNFIATCALGIEGLLADELKRIGLKNVIAENGRVLKQTFFRAFPNVFY